MTPKVSADGASSKPARKTGKISSWVIALAILATGLLTGWVMLQQGGANSWAFEIADNQAVLPGQPVVAPVPLAGAVPESLQYRARGNQQMPGIGNPTGNGSRFIGSTKPLVVNQPLANSVATNAPMGAAPMNTAPNQPPCARTVAWQPQVPTVPATPNTAANSTWNSATKMGGAPVIRANALPKHNERGACTNCHIVVDTLGKAVPKINSSAVLPHTLQRGVCTNCHQIAKDPQSIAVGGQVMGTQTAPTFNAPNRINSAPGINSTAGINRVAVAPGTANVPAPQTPQAKAAKPVPTEWEWLGLEVAPVTKMTVTQYKLPAGTRGLVVAEAEAQALTAGFKAGDVLAAINGIPIVDMRSFLQNTKKGTLPGAMVQVHRKRQLVTLPLGQTTPNVGGVK